MKTKIVLASQSPRRARLLKEAGISFITHPSNANEDLAENDPHKYTQALAKRKALAVQKQFPHDIILAADTVVYIDGRILGKPATPEDAHAMLSFLSNKKHHVVTGITMLYRDVMIVDSDEASLELHPLSSEQISRFIKATNPYDKAGGYSIEDLTPDHIRSLEGDKTTILGLPLMIVRKHLAYLTQLDDSP